MHPRPSIRDMFDDIDADTVGGLLEAIQERREYAEASLEYREGLAQDQVSESDWEVYNETKRVLQRRREREEEEEEDAEMDLDDPEQVREHPFYQERIESLEREAYEEIVKPVEDLLSALRTMEGRAEALIQALDGGDASQARVRLIRFSDSVVSLDTINDVYPNRHRLSKEETSLKRYYDGFAYQVDELIEKMRVVLSEPLESPADNYLAAQLDLLGLWLIPGSDENPDRVSGGAAARVGLFRDWLNRYVLGGMTYAELQALSSDDLGFTTGEKEDGDEDAVMVPFPDAKSTETYIAIPRSIATEAALAYAPESEA